MATWLLVWLLLSLAAGIALLVFAIALARHGLVLFRTVGRFSDEVGPIVEDISREADRARERASG